VPFVGAAEALRATSARNAAAQVDFMVAKGISVLKDAREKNSKEKKGEGKKERR
jgi:hypothetical protein